MALTDDRPSVLEVWRPRSSFIWWRPTRTDAGKADLTFHRAYQRAARSMAATASCCLSYRGKRVHKRLSRWQPATGPARIDNISFERETPPLSCDFIVSETWVASQWLTHSVEITVFRYHRLIRWFRSRVEGSCWAVNRREGPRRDGWDGRRSPRNYRKFIIWKLPSMEFVNFTRTWCHGIVVWER